MCQHLRYSFQRLLAVLSAQVQGFGRVLRLLFLWGFLYTSGMSLAQRFEWLIPREQEA